MNEPREDQNPSEDHIAYCAHQIWEHEGKPEGCDKDHWINARNRLIAGRNHIDMVPLNLHPILHLGHRHRSGALEQFHEDAFVRRVEMLDT